MKETQETLHAREVSLVSFDTVVLSTMWVVPLYSEPHTLGAVNASNIPNCSQMAGVTQASTYS